MKGSVRGKGSSLTPTQQQEAATALWEQQIQAAQEGHFRSGFVCIAGRPNVGKSTLLNCMLGQKVSIATSRPQTTRNPVLGIWNQPNVQVVFVDTPGVHLNTHMLGKRLTGYVKQSLRDADLVLCVVDPMRGAGQEQHTAFAWAQESGKPTWAVVNKIDAMAEGDVLTAMQRLDKEHAFEHIFPVSAFSGKGVALLLEKIDAHMQGGPPFFPPNQITDQNIHTQLAERIREAVFHRLYNEAPYSVAVTIEHTQVRKTVWVIHARIHVERASQKRLVIGQKGSMLKAIGTHARKTIETMLNTRVFLQIQVSVLSQWSKNPVHLSRLGLPEAP